MMYLYIPVCTYIHNITHIYATLCTARRAVRYGRGGHGGEAGHGGRRRGSHYSGLLRPLQADQGMDTADQEVLVLILCGSDSSSACYYY